MEKAVRRVNISEKSQLKIIQQNLAVVYPNMTLSSGLTGFETKRTQDKLTKDSIDAVYKNEAKSISFDTQLWLPPDQEGFQSDYKMRTYFITYRTSVLFGTSSQTSWNLSSDVVASGVNDVQIENLLQPVVIKFKPTAPVSGNERSLVFPGISIWMEIEVDGLMMDARMKEEIMNLLSVTAS